ncbi:uncharacterized protein LOC128556373 isoform X2 [Mercenaria mercenaria]|uniref:uncharacterized protein LOC128556373 isoform X2 n=1 Tax=Mercenaria mercenaria TaxID=6596 RepID=UPI00234EDCD8|nr:uncharacterized protein LOC128556373 isoform X2 [Mercenaria mercenaria]
MADELCTVLCFLIALSHFIQGQSVEYICPEHAGAVDYTIHDLYNDGVRIQNSSTISFQVKCEKNAYILLQEHRYDYKNLAVEIVLGTTENLGISISDKQSNGYTWCWEPGIVSKYEYRYFWISWENNVVRVGRGDTPNIKRLPCSERIAYAVNYVSIGTANHTKGYWKFNIGTPIAKTSPTTKTLHASSTTQLSTYKAENTSLNTNGNDEGQLTAVYVAVSLTVIVAVLVVAVILVLRRYQRSEKTKPEPQVVYCNTGNQYSVVNRNLTCGIENPAYDELILETETWTHCKNGEMPILNDNNYTESNLMEEQTVQLTTRENKSLPLQTDHEPDDRHVYNHVVEQNDLTPFSSEITLEEISKAEVKVNEYSHVACVTGDGNGGRTNLNEDNLDEERPHTKPESDIGVNNVDSKNMEEDTTTLYDHASAGGKGPAYTVSDEYSHLNDVKDNRGGQSSETPSIEKVTTTTKKNESDGYEIVAACHTPQYFILEPEPDKWTARCNSGHE